MQEKLSPAWRVSVPNIRHILSFGGGVNSAALMIILVRNKAPLDEVVFADTGGEVPETYSYLPVAQEYLAKHGVPFKVIAHRKGDQDLYANSWNRGVFPSAIWRWSTRDFKVLPLHRYYRTLGQHINQYLAIAYDEFERMKTSRVGYITNIYPLIDTKVTRQACIEAIQEEGLPVPVKSGCYFCPFNSLSRWQWLYEQHPDLYDNAIALEEHSKHFPAQLLTDQVFRDKAHIPLRQLPAHFRRCDVDNTESTIGICGGECMT